MKRNDIFIDALFQCVAHAPIEDREYVVQAAEKLKTIKRRKRFTKHMLRMIGDAKSFVAVYPNPDAPTKEAAE